jgi:hypothetical protein
LVLGIVLRVNVSKRPPHPHRVEAASALARILMQFFDLPVLPQEKI